MPITMAMEEPNHGWSHLCGYGEVFLYDRCFDVSSEKMGFDYPVGRNVMGHYNLVALWILSSFVPDGDQRGHSASNRKIANNDHPSWLTGGY